MLHLLKARGSMLVETVTGYSPFQHGMKALVSHQGVCRRETPVLALQVTGKRVDVDSDRSQAGMPQDLLQAEDISAIHEVVLGECVADGMR